jgi:DNA segregation ATPase FtsK/SpoIIIE, S-DNA-T family
MDVWLDQFHRIVTEGRQVGIHTVLTADRKGPIPSAIQSAIGNRLILRQADTNSYVDHGISTSRAAGIRLEPGAGLWQGDLSCVIACIAPTGDGPAQSDAIAATAATMRGAIASHLCSRPLPDTISLDKLAPVEEPSILRLGLRDLTGDPVDINLSYEPLIIVGNPRSGRTTAAATAAAMLNDRHTIWCVSPAKNSPLRNVVDADHGAFGDTAAIETLIDKLTANETVDARHVVIVDDVDLIDRASHQRLAALADRDGIHLIATFEIRHLQGGWVDNDVITRLRTTRTIVVLQPDDPGVVYNTFGVKAPIRPGTRMPRGRGVLIVNREPVVVHVATPWTEP